MFSTIDKFLVRRTHENRLEIIFKNKTINLNHYRV